MKLGKIVLVAGFFLLTTKGFSQYLPESYQPMLTEIASYFETIRTGNSLTKGTTSIRVFSADKIVLRIKHKGSVKNLTFEKKPDEENQMQWKPANQLTIDMVNKYEKYLTNTLHDMHDLAKKKSQE